jgi:hypothetical protein
MAIFGQIIKILTNGIDFNFHLALIFGRHGLQQLAVTLATLARVDKFQTRMPHLLSAPTSAKQKQTKTNKNKNIAATSFVRKYINNFYDSQPFLPSY